MADVHTGAMRAWHSGDYKDPDETRADIRNLCDVVDALRARLAAVEALCDWADDNVPSHIRLIDYCRFVLRVRTAARGEGDRG